MKVDYEKGRSLLTEARQQSDLIARRMLNDIACPPEVIARHNVTQRVWESWLTASIDALLNPWRPISELKLDDSTGWGFRVYAPSLYDADFNPSGTADGTLHSDEPGAPIEVAKWNGSQDCWDSVEITDATHFCLHVPPPTHFREIEPPGGNNV